MSWELCCKFDLLMHLRPNNFLNCCPPSSLKVPFWSFKVLLSLGLFIQISPLYFWVGLAFCAHTFSFLRCCFTSNITVPCGCSNVFETLWILILDIVESRKRLWDFILKPSWTRNISDLPTQGSVKHNILLRKSSNAPSANDMADPWKSTHFSSTCSLL